MSTLRFESNPFLVHGRSHSDNYYISRDTNNSIDHSNMPRTYSPSANVTTPYTDRKRKFDEDLLVTPDNLNNKDVIITPPRSYKRSKTVPSSPINSQTVYETPKTPSFKEDFTISLGNTSSFFSPSSPSYQSSLLSSSSNFEITESVTPPQSINGSPRQVTTHLSTPTVIPSRQSHGEYAYMYADTCYPFNIAGSAIGRSEGNLRLKTWRGICNEKVRHEYNKALKDYNVYSSKLEAEMTQKMDQASMNPPVLLDEKIFPSATKMSNIAFRKLNYPFVSRIDNSQKKIEEEVHLLLNLKNQNIKKTATYPLKNSPNVRLPPISDILKVSPFDKSTIHPSGLSTLEIKQYQDSSFPGVIFERNSKMFYNGKEIKKNNAIIMEDNIPIQRNYKPTFNKNSLSQYSIGNYQQQISNELKSIIPTTINSSLIPPVKLQPQLQSPIKLRPIITHGGKNAYDDLNNQIKDLSDNEDIKKNSMKQFQTQFRAHSLNVKKTRKNSVSKVEKHKRNNSNLSNSTVTSRRSSRSSRSPSRKSSDSNSFINNNKKTVSELTTDYRIRTRSFSRSRSSSTDSIKTAEAPASVETTPKTSPTIQKQKNYIVKTNSLLFPPQEKINYSNISNHNNKILDFSKSTILSIEPVKAQISIGKLTSHSQNVVKPIHSHQQTSSSNQHINRSKKCMSCFSSSSPCWRPSWSPEEGQLCNSCGLRYRKTKARCYNPSCLKIPSKSEWALMVKRGEVLLDIHDSNGNIIGKKMSYRCLDCDSAMEVLH